MPETAVYSSTTTEVQRVFEMTNPVKAQEIVGQIPLSFLTAWCKSEKSDQLRPWSGASDRASIFCLVHNTHHFSHKSDELTIQGASPNLKNDICLD